MEKEKHFNDLKKLFYIMKKHDIQISLIYYNLHLHFFICLTLVKKMFITNIKYFQFFIC